MQSIKKPNLTNLKRTSKDGTSYITYIYRYVVKVSGRSIRKFITLGTSRDLNRTQVLGLYKQAQVIAWNEKLGLVQPEQTNKDEQQPILLCEVFDEWVAHEKNRSRTWLRDIHNLKHFVLFFGKEGDWKKNRVTSNCKIDLAKLSAKDINAFYDDQYEQGYKTETVSKRNNYLNPLYTWLTNEGILKDNYYARKGKLKEVGTDKTPYQVLTRDQAESIVANAPSSFLKTFWSIMLDTALSPIDALKLNKKNDLTVGTNNDGEKVSCIVTSRKKTGKFSAIAISWGLQQLGDDIWTLEGAKTEIDDSNDEFKKVCRKLGIKQEKGEKLSQYCFRHSLATHLVNQGWELDQVQRALGHTLGSKVTQGYIANQIANEVTKQQQVTKRTA